MGSLDAGSLPLKRAAAAPGAPHPRSAFTPAAAAARRLLLRFLLFEKVDYLQWIGISAAFFFVVLVFHSILGPPLPLPLVRPSGDARRMPSPVIAGCEFGEGIEMAPKRLPEKWRRERQEQSNGLQRLSRAVVRSGVRKPRIAMVFADLEVTPLQVQMVSVAVAAASVGYEIEVYSFEDGSAGKIWSSVGAGYHILHLDMKLNNSVDWLNYECVVVTSLEAMDVFSSLLQEPFKSVPVIWTINDDSLAIHTVQYNSSGSVQIMSQWKQCFSRSSVVVFPNYVLPVMYASFDSGNYFVVPGSPAEAMVADIYISLINNNSSKISNGSRPTNFSVTIVGSQYSYSGKWIEHLLVLKALHPLLCPSPFDGTTSWLKIRLLSERLSDRYKMAIEVASINIGFPKGVVETVVVDENICSLLGASDVVIYGSFLEEHTFPSVLLQAMSLRKLIVAPDLKIIRKYIDDRVHGYLFPKDNIGVLTEVVRQAFLDSKLTRHGHNIATAAELYAKNLLATENIEGFVSLLGNVVKLPSEVSAPGVAKDIPLSLKERWQWYLFANVTKSGYGNMSSKVYKFSQKLKGERFQYLRESSKSFMSKSEEDFSLISWDEVKSNEILIARRRLEEEELKGRSGQPHLTWEEVYRNAKRSDRLKNELHETEDMELERTGQPLCIYEPFLGEGTWPFLHRSSLYRGIGLSSKGRRPGADDIDASSRLPLLMNGYYRDLLGEFSALFALSNRIDHIHKNAWIGFQSWRATAIKAELSEHAESSILEAIQTKRHGDAIYFWVRMDQDYRSTSQQDFWSFCDAINAGNCRSAILGALTRMYGLQHNLDSLPPMPNEEGTWSVIQSWVMPTRSFLEFVMFSRMFVDALDADMHDVHHQSGFCYLSLHKDKHCYSRLLELLVNIWAYHSARIMIYVDPRTGDMVEQHPLASRRNLMWIEWFSYATLKAMDEDLAEEYDIDGPRSGHWLWPLTGEVFWQGVYERERSMRHQQKELRKQQSRDKILRIKKRARQKTLGKYIRPPPEDEGGSNRTSSS